MRDPGRNDLRLIAAVDQHLPPPAGAFEPTSQESAAAPVAIPTASALPSPSPSPVATPSSSPSSATSGSASGAAALTTTAVQARSYVVLGDSLSVWAFAPSNTRSTNSKAWPYLLAAQDADLTLIRDAGVPGNTTAQMLARLKRDVFAYHPDVLFILGGTNDIGKRYSAATILDNLHKIIDLARAQGIEVVVLTIPPNNEISHYQLERLRAVNAGLIRLGATEGFKVVDVYAALSDSRGHLPSVYAAYDGLHLSVRGEAALAAAVYARLTAVPAVDPDR